MPVHSSIVCDFRPGVEGWRAPIFWPYDWCRSSAILGSGTASVVGENVNVTGTPGTETASLFNRLTRRWDLGYRPQPAPTAPCTSSTHPAAAQPPEYGALLRHRLPARSCHFTC